MKRYKLDHSIMDGQIFMHGNVFAEWSPSLKREALSEFKEFLRERNYPIIYCAVSANDPKLNKWVEMWRFKKLSSSYSKEGEFVNIYRMDSRCYK